MGLSRSTHHHASREFDDRRVHLDAVNIGGSPDDNPVVIQAEINQMHSSSVGVLSIDGRCDDAVDPVLELFMPQLEEAKFINVNFSKLVLNTETTPGLRTIELQHLPEECAIEVKCPQLTHANISYVYGLDWVQEMLDAAQELVSFRSHKLWLHQLHFASTQLSYVHIDRSDLCENMSIWAPQLSELRLLACHELEWLAFPIEHPSLRSWRSPSNSRVVTTNSITRERVTQELESNPRVRWDGPTDFS